MGSEDCVTTTLTAVYADLRMLNLWGLIAGTASNHVEVEPLESLGHFCSSFDLPRVCKVPCSLTSSI